jgi:nitrite reductase (cytochrome c-552)
VPRTPTQADPRSVVARSKSEEDKGLKAIWQGYAFSEDFREERGHAYMLEDQRLTKRQVVVKQPGACVNCHASMYLAYKKAGNGDITKGFEKINAMPYAEATKLVSHPVACIDCHDGNDTRTASHPPGVHRRHACLQGFAGRERLRREQAEPRPPKCAPTCAASATSSTTSRVPKAPRLSLGEGPQGRGDHRLLRRDRLP